MPNRLARETSPYLLQHAENPVDWYPWGEEAFGAARARDLPILLSIGYSACHWCHVMERESFEDPAIAAQMNSDFVCVKVDREERPDLDQLYQGVVHLLGRGGGWPLTVFLTPDLRPFFGGTYFPPDDRHGMPGLPRMLAALAEAWRTRRGDLEAGARELVDGLGQLMRPALAAPTGPVRAGEIAAAGDRLARHLDPVFGGFAGRPKFPQPSLLAAMLRAHRRGASEACAEGVSRALTRMARGGLFDQLGGGFHRYSVDERWEVPHFEKMLYDNALLLRVYAEAWQRTRDPLFARVVEQTVGWLDREMSAPGGGFCSSQDADAAGEEGSFFVFSPSEVARAVGEARAPLLCRHLGITPEGNFEDGRTVPSLAADAAELAAAGAEGGRAEQVAAALAEGRRALYEARERRPRPARDDKVLAGWNGLAIGGLARAARAFDRPDWAHRAAAAADFALGELVDRGGRRLRRSFRDGRAAVDGMLEDYGDLAWGLVDLYMATFAARYLEAAARLAGEALDRFWDASAGAFRTAAVPAPAAGTEAAAPPLPAPLYSVEDNAWPSGASTLTEALVLLAGLTSTPRFFEAAGEYLGRLRAAMVEQPFGFGQLLCAADTWLDGAATLVVAGRDSEAAGLLREAGRRWTPTLAVAWADPGAPVPALLAATFEGKRPRDGLGTAYLCRAFTCAAPTTSPAVLDAFEAAPPPPPTG